MSVEKQGLRIKDSRPEEFYSYTSGRWLWSEKENLADRYVKFDIAALCKVAASCTGSEKCLEIIKVPEGNFNKVFLLRMNGGREIIAKIPNPNAGRAFFLTASEVATLEYVSHTPHSYSSAEFSKVRNILKIPVPKVLAWSAKAEESEVGAEFIIMEKAPGVQLASFWDTMHPRKRLEILRQFVMFDKTLASNHFPAHGSLYYEKDLSSIPGQIYFRCNKDHSSGHQYCVGPTNNRNFFDGGRGALTNLDRGPWSCTEDYFVANAERELISIENIPQPPQKYGIFNGPGQYQTSKSMKERVLRDYLRIVKHLVPKTADFHEPVLWHLDLHTDNIFVDPEQPTKITSIIDWQAVHIAPLFLQIRHPAFLDYDGPILEELKPAPLPDNFKELSAEAKKQAVNLRAAQSLYKMYDVDMLMQCPEAGKALRHQDTLTSRIAGCVRSVFTDGEPVLAGYLMQAADNWDQIVGQDLTGQPLVPCPLKYTEEEKAQQKEAQAKWEAGVSLLAELREDLGVYEGWEGLVSHQDYETMKQQLSENHERFLERMSRNDEERAQWAKVWPFQDHVHG